MTTAGCVICAAPLPPSTLYDGFTTHTSCDALWEPHHRVRRISDTVYLTLTPCSQLHEAALFLGEYDTVRACLSCVSDTHPAAGARR